jgi:AraC-like DNA-binding protein
MTPQINPQTKVGFRSSHGAPVEAVPLDRIRQTGSAAHLASVQWPKFTMFLLYTQGAGQHVLDFTPHAIAPGTLIMVRAGTSHQFQLSQDMDGVALVVSEDFILPDALSPLRQVLSQLDWHVASTLSPAAQDEFLSTCAAIERDAERHAGQPLLPHLLRERLFAFLVALHLDWAATRATPTEHGARRNDIMRDFRRLVEARFLDRWSVADYARKLGYAERTLTRACLAVEGRSAKAMIDDRLALEARRWIANSDDTLEAIAHRLRFGEASNLTQFFRRVTGRTPSDFRAEWRGDQPVMDRALDRIQSRVSAARSDSGARSDQTR